MQTLKTLLTNVRKSSVIRRASALTALLLVGTLFGAVRAHADDSDQVYLGSASSGYVNVTSYLQTDQYGNIWVVGYDGDPNFEIILDAVNGQVLDPYGDQIGYFTEPRPV